MPPYRANVGGMFGSGQQPRAGGNVDIAGAINAIGNQASSLIQSAYLRKLAEREREQQALLMQQAQEDRRLARSDVLAQRAIDQQRRVEDVAFRERQLAATQEQRRLSAQPKPTYDATRGVFITPPSATSAGSAVPVKDLPAKPKEERSGAAGTFYPQVNPETGETTYFNPQTGATVKAPAGLQPRDAATATDITKQRRAVAGVRGALDAFKANIETNGIALMPGVVRSGQETDYENLQLQMKELYNLGVLNGPDLALMRRIVNEPGAFGTLIRAAGSPERAAQMILGQITKLQAEIDKREGNLRPTSLRPVAPGRPGVDRPPFDPNDPD